MAWLPFRLDGGRRVQIRPIEREDRDRFRGLYARLTPESRYRRFLSPKPQLNERELAYFVDVDHVRHEALVAIDESDGSLLAAARYVQLADQPHIAEVAIEVADDVQGQGLGTALAIQTLQRARANGLTHLTATTLHENVPALALLRALHFRRRSRDRHEIEFGLELTPDWLGWAVRVVTGGHQAAEDAAILDPPRALRRREARVQRWTR